MSNKILLSMEMPTSKLEEWSPLADFDFVLAHKVLEDKAYREHFLNRPKGREVLLDNSYHELGQPLSTQDLLQAAVMCQADYVITPDKVNDPEFTLRHYNLAAPRLVDAGFKVAVVWVGPKNDDLGQARFLANTRDADMLCCTFKHEDRHEWFTTHMAQILLHHNRVHLLGVSELSELKLWAKTLRHINAYRAFSPITMSVDTGKAIKWAMKLKRLDEVSSLRSNAMTTSTGAPSEVSQKILEIPAEDINPFVAGYFEQNVKLLREACG